MSRLPNTTTHLSRRLEADQRFINNSLLKTSLDARNLFEKVPFRNPFYSNRNQIPSRTTSYEAISTHFTCPKPLLLESCVLISMVSSLLVLFLFWCIFLWTNSCYVKILMCFYLFVTAVWRLRYKIESIHFVRSLRRCLENNLWLTLLTYRVCCVKN